MLAMVDQSLVELTGEHRDAVDARVMPEPVAGHADLAAAGLEQHVLIEIGPLLNRGFESGGQGRWQGPELSNKRHPPQLNDRLRATVTSPFERSASEPAR